MRAEEAYALSQRVDPDKARASLFSLLNQISNEAAMGTRAANPIRHIEDKTLAQLRALGYVVEYQVDYDEDTRYSWYFINWAPPKPISRPKRQTILGKTLDNRD